ncbi:hypothetical protein [Dyella sp.]|uniref:hypothetical protein n=1 Tax=Dyella sp. TaxID=1869338 RepID=UPI002ED37BF3
MRLPFASLVYVLLLIAASASADDSLKIETQQVPKYVAFLEDHPLDKLAPYVRSALLQWEDKTTDVVDVVCQGVLAPLPDTSIPHSSELIGQFIFGSAAHQIAVPADKDKLIPNQLAGMRSLLKAYANIVRQEPNAHHARLDELSRHEADGTLATFLTPVIAASCKS